MGAREENGGREAARVRAGGGRPACRPCVVIGGGATCAAGRREARQTCRREDGRDGGTERGRRRTAKKEWRAPGRNGEERRCSEGSAHTTRTDTPPPAHNVTSSSRRIGWQCSAGRGWCRWEGPGLLRCAHAAVEDWKEEEGDTGAPRRKFARGCTGPCARARAGRAGATRTSERLAPSPSSSSSS